MNDNFTEIQKTFSRSFGLEPENLISKETIIEAIALRIAYMLERRTEQIFSMLYRLDISEKKLKEVMTSNNDVPVSIATLIYERQCEKVSSREKNRPEQADDDLAW